MLRYVVSQFTAPLAKNNLTMHTIFAVIFKKKYGCDHTHWSPVAGGDDPIPLRSCVGLCPDGLTRNLSWY